MSIFVNPDETFQFIIRFKIKNIVIFVVTTVKILKSNEESYNENIYSFFDTKRKKF